jgi:hypothetical protein
VLAADPAGLSCLTSSGIAAEQRMADYRVTLIRAATAGPVRPADMFGAVPDLPWTARAEMEPGTGYLVMASHLPLRRITATVRFFRAVLAVRKQLVTADGLIGYTLRAKPLARDYWTLSVWKDDTALRQFMRTPPHEPGALDLGHVTDQAVQGEPGGCHGTRLSRVIGSGTWAQTGASHRSWRPGLGGRARDRRFCGACR